LGYIADMSFILILVLIAVLVLGGFRLVRHDRQARAGSESHHPPAP